MARTYQENRTQYYNKKNEAKKCTTNVYFSHHFCAFPHEHITYFDKLLHEALKKPINNEMLSSNMVQVNQL